MFCWIEKFSEITFLSNVIELHTNPKTSHTKTKNY